MYDIAIVGAGINGASVAHEFISKGKSVIVFDKEYIASGGSGAAGAFISPKFSKSGDLKEIIHDAFVYSMDFYSEKFPNLFTKTNLIHIAKNEKDSEILKYYKSATSLKLKSVETEYKTETISLESGLVDASAMCNEMCSGAKFVKLKVESLIYDNSHWIINNIYSAKNVVLATGAYQQVIDEPYIKLRGIWGHRIDVKTSTENKNSLHQFVSISQAKNNIVAIGATHNVHYHPETSKEPYDIESGRAELLEKTFKTIKLDDVEVIKDYTGLRSGSFDYMPILGPLVISKETLKSKTIRFKVKKPNYSEYTYYPNLYMINGNGGYGFVLAPYLAKILSEHILSAKEIDKKLIPARFFARWVKR
jgi:tRNA 5-methylaminomethyl-2-thiouridine biosynthesis bifunctional protein